MEEGPLEGQTDPVVEAEAHSQNLREQETCVWCWRQLSPGDYG